jgi:hypothetical protein
LIELQDIQRAHSRNALLNRLAVGTAAVFAHRKQAQISLNSKLAAVL